MKKLFAASILAMSITCPTHAEDFWMTSDFIQRSFNEIALKNEYEQSPQNIVKWAEPIHYRYRYHDIKQLRDVENLFTIHFKHLSEITQLPIYLAHPRGKVNYEIHIVSDKNYPQLVSQISNVKTPGFAESTHCIGVYKINQRGEIVHGHIVLPIDHLYQQGRLVSCVVEESFQLMGLPNDSDWVYPSVANDKTVVDYLSGLDYLMLKILYDKKITAGMKYRQSQPIINDIIERMQRDGTVRNAIRAVKASGLQPYMRQN